MSGCVGLRVPLLLWSGVSTSGSRCCAQSNWTGYVMGASPLPPPPGQMTKSTSGQHDHSCRISPCSLSRTTVLNRVSWWSTAIGPFLRCPPGLPRFRSLSGRMYRMPWAPCACSCFRKA
eukprot:3901954-Rhodomonas_salina.3